MIHTLDPCKVGFPISADTHFATLMADGNYIAGNLNVGLIGATGATGTANPRLRSALC